jgi:tetratricopeptide (TPR) repeat protein
LEAESAQAQILNDLASAYALSGQPRRAVPLFLASNEPDEKNGNKRGVAIGLGNVAQFQWAIGALAQAQRNLRHSSDLFREIEYVYGEGVGHAELGHLLIYTGLWGNAENEFSKAIELFEKGNNIQYIGVVWSYRALHCLLMAREAVVSDQSYPTGTMSVIGYYQSAVEHAKRALELADETTRTRMEVPRDYIHAHWLLGAAYRALGACPEWNTAGAQSKDDLARAETHLGEALRRCRAINLVEVEADILLELAKLRHAQGEPPEAQRLANEALLITERSGYVLQGADVHLFLAVLAENREKRIESSEWGGRETALEHAKQAHQLATGWEMVDGKQVYDESGEYVYKVAYDEAGAMIQRMKDER